MLKKSSRSDGRSAFSRSRTWRSRLTRPPELPDQRDQLIFHLLDVVSAEPGQGHLTVAADLYLYGASRLGFLCLDEKSCELADSRFAERHNQGDHLGAGKRASRDHILVRKRVGESALEFLVGAHELERKARSVQFFHFPLPLSPA